MPSLVVDSIVFDFDESWSVDRWDDSPLFLKHIRSLQGQLDGRPEGTKAVDIYGVRERVPYLIEVKDFRAYAIENKQRQLRELPLELGLKARDSLAGIAGLCSRGNPPTLARQWLSLIEAGEAARVCAWISEDGLRPGEALHARAGRHLERADQIKKCLHWLTTKVLVNDPLALEPDWGVAAKGTPRHQHRK